MPCKLRSTQFCKPLVIWAGFPPVERKCKQGQSFWLTLVTNWSWYCRIYQVFSSHRSCSYCAVMWAAASYYVSVPLTVHGTLSVAAPGDELSDPFSSHHTPCKGEREDSTSSAVHRTLESHFLYTGGATCFASVRRPPGRFHHFTRFVKTCFFCRIFLTFTPVNSPLQTLIWDFYHCNFNEIFICYLLSFYLLLIIIIIYL